MAKTRSNGKLIDTWHYEYSGIPAHQSDDPEEETGPPKVKPIKVAVNLYIYKEYAGVTPPLAVKEVYFVVKCKNPEFQISGSDIEALRAAMWEHLDEHYAVQWEKWFLVEIRYHGPYEGMGSGLTFGYKDVERGVAYDGTELLRERKWGMREETISPWPGEFRDKRGDVIACIPATPQNQKAMKEFAARIDILREKLIELVKPEQILQTIATLSGIPLLPPISAEVEDEKLSDPIDAN